jgi:hypothetical protein
MDLYQQIANRIGRRLDDLLTTAIDAACITEQEWNTDPEACEARINGALEELYDFDL